MSNIQIKSINQKAWTTVPTKDPKTTGAFLGVLYVMDSYFWGGRHIYSATRIKEIATSDEKMSPETYIWNQGRSLRGMGIFVSVQRRGRAFKSPWVVLMLEKIHCWLYLVSGQEWREKCEIVVISILTSDRSKSKKAFSNAITCKSPLRSLFLKS